MLRVMGEDGARGKDWLRARGHHLCLTDTIFELNIFAFKNHDHSFICVPKLYIVYIFIYVLHFIYQSEQLYVILTILSI